MRYAAAMPDEESPTSTSAAVDALGLFAKSQEQALKVANETFNRAKAMTGLGVAAPAALAQQVADLSSAVAGLAGGATGVAGAVVQPLQDFIVQQRKMAETVAKFAEVQAELAQIVAEFADRQAAAVAAVERLTVPVFDLMGTKGADG